ncbi:MAG: hypothetical protein Q7J34_04395 [Bacteroidales bacterium]|jgi:hypothetical protein|nr:hypothetical protein [Bacteroidales bacterium]
MAKKMIFPEDLVLQRLAQLGLLITNSVVIPEEFKKQLLKEYLFLRLDISLWMSYKGSGLCQRYLDGSTHRLLHMKQIMKSQLRSPNQRRGFYESLYEIQYQVEMLLKSTRDISLNFSKNIQSSNYS